jgi:DNA-binding transcriptional LysR family regulator
MSLRQLRYLTAVAEAGSFRKASEVVNISQPALSQEIRKLEQQLGGPLLVRSHAGVTLTDKGRIVCSLGDNALDRRRQAVTRALAQVAEQSRSLRLSGNSTALSMVVPRLMAQLRDDMPDMQLHLVDEFAAYQVELLRSRQVDAAFLCDLQYLDGLLVHEVTSFDFIVARQHNDKDGPPNLGALIRPGQVWLDLMPGLDPGRDLALAPVRRRLRSADCQVELYQSTETILAMIRGGHGVAIVPRDLAGLAIPSIVFGHDPIGPPNPVFAATLQNGGVMATVFERVVRAAFPKARRLD